MSQTSPHQKRSSGEGRHMYIGVFFDSKLNLKENISSVLKKFLILRMHCLRKLISFGVKSDMFVSFFLIFIML